MKKCSRCEKIKHLNEFHKDKSSKGGVHPQCRQCKKEYRDAPEIKEKAKEYRSKNKEKMRAYSENYHQVVTYGITIEEKEAMLYAQGGTCAMCPTKQPGGTHNKWHTDHNHTTGKVRAILCFRCNRDLGYYEVHKDKCEKFLEEYDG